MNATWVFDSIFALVCPAILLGCELMLKGHKFCKISKSGSILVDFCEVGFEFPKTC